MLISISKAAKELGVSISTLRNWDKSNYFTSVKTKGKHRRYDWDKVKNFGTKLTISWNGVILHKLYDEFKERATQRYSYANAIGGFSKLEIQLLKYNQRLVENPEAEGLLKYNQRIVENPEAERGFHVVAEHLISPYLFAVHVMTHPTTLVTRLCARRHEQRTFLCPESEEVVAANQTVEDCYIDDNQAWIKIANEFDKTNIDSIKGFAGTVSKCKKKDIKVTLEKVIQAINSKTQVDEPKWILVPPELSHLWGSKCKTITPMLSKIEENVFVSRHLDKNNILIGTKSVSHLEDSMQKNLRTFVGFNGFIFCPYILAVGKSLDFVHKCYSSMGRRLLRDGSYFYGSIEVIDA